LVCPLSVGIVPIPQRAQTLAAIKGEEMRKIICILFVLISISSFAQFNEPIQINGPNIANIDGQNAYKIIGENVYITYLEEHYIFEFAQYYYTVMFKLSEDNGQNFVTTQIDSIPNISKANPVLEVLSDDTIIIIYNNMGLKKAISVDNANSFQIEEVSLNTFEQIHITNQNDIISIAIEDNDYTLLQNHPFQIENFISSTNRDISQIEQNGIRPFPPDTEIVYVKINGNSYTSMIGNIEHVADSSFIVYNSYPDAEHPDFPIGDSIWVNEVAIYDTIWAEGPSGILNNQSVWVECVLWIEGMVGGLQSWGCPENIYITNDLYYENTEIGNKPDNLFNMNLTDFIGLYSEDRILIKYKHFDPFINEIVAPNCDGDVYIYGLLIALEDDLNNSNTGYFSFEYHHPHGSTPNFWWTNPSTGDEEFLTYIDLHKFILNPTEPVPADLEPFILHGNNPPTGFPACGHPYESPDYAQPDIPPYGTDYPWYNPVWPESSDDIVYERGIFHFYGSVVQRRRGFIHRSGNDPYNHPSSHEWDIENHHYDGFHGSVGYSQDKHFDGRLLFQKLIDISLFSSQITNSYKILRSIDNGNTFYTLDEQTIEGARYNLQMCANDSLLVFAYQESRTTLFNLKLYHENTIYEFSIDLSNYPEIFNPVLLDMKLKDYLFIHISNSDIYFYNNSNEFIIEYDLENNEIESITTFEPDYNLTDFNISNSELKVVTTCEMLNDELNPEPLSLFFNCSDDDNWIDVYNFETDFTNFSPYSSKIALNFNETDSLYFILNKTDSLTFLGNIYLMTGSNNFLTEYSDVEIINPKLSLHSYPNPFNPSTIILFTISKETNVNLSIYNIKGQKVKILIHNKLAKGSHSIIWNGDDNKGKSVSSGLYFYKLNLDGKTGAVNKCLLLK